MPQTPYSKECNCTFDVNPDSDMEDSEQTAWHYKRVCSSCGQVHWKLDCWHQQAGWKCRACGEHGTDVPDGELAKGNGG